MFNEFDKKYMNLALQLAKKGLYSTSPNPMVGCVIVKNDSVVGEGYHQKSGGPHAEVMALQNAGKQAEGAEAYVTLEPCNHTGQTAPCTEALLKAKVRRVVYATEDPNKGVVGGGGNRLKENGVIVDSGCLKQEAKALNKSFFFLMATGKPWVTVKVGMSLDGFSAMASGESKWITSTESRKNVQKLRAKASAILTGSGTILADNPSLTVRDSDYDTKGRNPIIVIVDRRLRIDPAAKVLSHGEVILFTHFSNSKRVKRNVLTDLGCKVEYYKSLNRDGEIEELMKRLGKLGINNLLVEAGGNLTNSILETNLWNELVVYIAPKILGVDARPAFNRSSERFLSDVSTFKLVESTTFNQDVKLTYENIK